MRITLHTTDPVGITLLGCKVSLLVGDRHLHLREVVKEGDLMTFTFEDPWSVDA